jgi:hypothetical protein
LCSADGKIDVLQLVSPIVACTFSEPNPTRFGPASTRRISPAIFSGTVMKYQLALSLCHCHSLPRTS